MPTATPVLVTYEESLLRPETSLEEVIYGELHVMPPPTIKHNRILQRLVRVLLPSMGPSLDFAWDTGFLIAQRPELRYRVPDLAIANREILDGFAERDQVYASFAPAAVIEVLSPANRKGNLAQLLQDYLDLGVNEIVFLNPEQRSVSVNGSLVPSGTFTVVGITVQAERFW